MELTFSWVKGNKKCVEQLISGNKNSHEENSICPYSGKWLRNVLQNVLWRGDWTEEGDGHDKIQAGSFSGQKRPSVMVLGKKYRGKNISEA